MKIYTRGGDGGTTALIGGKRVPKNDLRIAAYGDVDELNAALGVCRVSAPPTAIGQVVERLQHELFSVGAELAAPDAPARKLAVISEAHIARLEADIDRFDESLPALQQFILPGGTAAAAALHAARCVCRRAERSVVALSASEQVRGELVRYLNRVSDLLFMTARRANAEAGKGDTAWQKPSGDSNAD